jgi:RES domain-containing protein
MRVFRIEREKYLKETLTGSGAARSEHNRWNSLNTPLVYTSQSRALAMLELLVHTDISLGLPLDRYFVEIEIPENLPVIDLDRETLPEKWNSSPTGFETQKLGDQFVIEQQAPILKVPSSIVPAEFNYLINPLHSSASGIHVISVELLSIDGRLIAGLSAQSSLKRKAK